MKFYWPDDDEIYDLPFGEPLPTLFVHGLPPYLCIYLKSELDDYIASKHNARVGFLMAERYIRTQVQPSLTFHGEVLMAKEYL